MTPALTIALVGNPNSGKTTLFNDLTGSSQYVGNWPGVTVEKKLGPLRKHDQVQVVDLPGVYSLSPYSPEEVVARDYLLQEKPDVVLNIVDGTNLERNLYLTTQLLEIGLPLVVAVNLMDEVSKQGDAIHLDLLQEALGCPVLGISALKGEGIEEVIQTALGAKEQGLPPRHYFSGPIEHALAHIEEAILHDRPAADQHWYALKIFERDQQILDQLQIPPATLRHIEGDIQQAEQELGDDAESLITSERYRRISEILALAYERKSAEELSRSDKLDRLVTNPWLALPIFAAVMTLVFYLTVSTVGAWADIWISKGIFGQGIEIFGTWVPGLPVALESGLTALGAAPWLQSLVIDGVLAGVGAVLGFVPQMLVLFLLLSFLELSGYMARVAFIFDRTFCKFGLSGKSFVPMLVSAGCGVAGIMAARTIENERDRRMTIITATFMPCGGKVPLIVMIGTLLFDGDWWFTPLAYFIGLAVIAVSGIILKKSKFFAGEPAPFLMELPAYRLPQFASLMRIVWERVRSFIQRAGTVIFISSIILWLGSRLGFVAGQFTFAVDLPLYDSLIGRLGAAISFIFRPLGFGQASATIATLMGLIAKEETVAVFGVLDFAGLSRLAAFSFLIFNLICSPCIAAIGAMRQELADARWTAFALAYQTGFAYALSLMIYQFGLTAQGQPQLVGLIFASATLALLAYLLFRPAPKLENL